MKSIFFEFTLPNATTWAYFSFVLAVALFFKFSRLLSMRNWDVVTLFLLVPGFLLLQEGHRYGASNQVWYGYVWLLVGSGYLFVRCLMDLALVRRPALSPNLNFGGLAWLAGALLVSLTSVAYRPSAPLSADNAEPVGKLPAAVTEVQRIGENQVKQQTAVERTGVEARFWVERTLALLCHLAILVGLVSIGHRHFHDVHAGMAAVTFYLLLPYTAIHVGQVHHVWPTALLIWAVAAYRRPTVAGVLLGVASGTAYFPALVFPVWFSFYWRRGAGRFLAAFLLTAVLSLAVTGFFLWWHGELEQSLQSVLALSDWQPWKEPKTEGFWIGVHWAYRIPVFIAYLAFLFTTFFWPAPKNLAQVLALTAATLIGIQFWYADQGGVFVLWYLPLLLLLAFRPNLSDRRPPSIRPEEDWLRRFGQFLAQLAGRFLHAPEPVVKVH